MFDREVKQTLNFSSKMSEMVGPFAGFIGRQWRQMELIKSGYLVM